MSSATMSMLDQEELLQLALNSSNAGDSGSAIAYLKEAVGRVDATPVAHYILGAEYAQIKMYQRAVEEMEAAIVADPGLSIARLQLGLLCLTMNEPARAEDTLAPLAQLSEQDPLRHFGQGLQHLMRDEITAARQCLNSGIALNQNNPMLNVDMQNILTEIEKLQPAVGGTSAASQDEGSTSHILISAYTGNQT